LKKVFSFIYAAPCVLTWVMSHLCAVHQVFQLLVLFFFYSQEMRV
jgi:hypothetical protein